MRVARRRMAGLLAIGMLAGCQVDFPHFPTFMSPELAQVLNVRSVPFRSLILGGQVISEGEPGTYVFVSKAQQDADWRRLKHFTHPRHRLPDVVDFDREQGVLVVFGAQPTGMNWGEIVAIEELPETFVVRTVMWTPTPGLAVTADIGFPWHYVAMPKSDKPVSFAATVRGTYDKRPSGRPDPVWTEHLPYEQEAPATPRPTPTPTTTEPRSACVVNPSPSPGEALWLEPPNPCIGQTAILHARGVGLAGEWLDVSLIEGRVEDRRDINPCLLGSFESIGAFRTDANDNIYQYPIEIKERFTTNLGKVVYMRPDQDYTITVVASNKPRNSWRARTTTFNVCKPTTLIPPPTRAL